MAGERDDFENAAGRRQYTKPHSGRHPIPTIQSYRHERKKRDGQQEEEESAQKGPEDESKPKRAFEAARGVIKGEDHLESRGHDPYPSANHNDAERPIRDGGQDHGGPDQGDQGAGEDSGGGHSHKEQERQQGEGKSATETAASTLDPREKRKAMKKTKRHGGGREVTDPVTHLPIVIHDHTDKDLKSVPENEPEPGTNPETATGPQGASKSEEQLGVERHRAQKVHNGVQKVFPPPDFDVVRSELAGVYQRATYAGLALVGLLCVGFFILRSLLAGSRAASQDKRSASASLLHYASTSLGVSVFGALLGLTIWGMGKWTNKKVEELFDDETWDAVRRQEIAEADDDAELPESAQWMNNLFSAIWPLINPDLFASLVDMIEDVMQASLPKAIKMVSVDDMGQGNEAFRILGVHWLPTGAASRSVSRDGKLKVPNRGSESDRSDPENPQANSTAEGGSESEDGPNQRGGPEDQGGGEQDKQEQIAVREGMEAEEGDFVNLELALAYRGRSSGKTLKSKAKNAHLYLKFYLPGGIAVPVWVEIRGLVATLRLRLQLTPDPPFISLCTMTFLGQPKASLSCVPLSKHSLNLMDVPLISSFVQSAIDAALAEYVAPKSLTLNLKDMLVGEDFKKDTTSKGVVWIFIKRARGFKQGDGGIGPIQGSSDSYVTVSWGKFGKPAASTRIVMDEQEPDWHEYSNILVTPEEVNAEEKLRLQLWDSDKWTADDDLGRVEVHLKTLMGGKETCNRIQDREDRFTGQDPNEKMAGSLEWSVGYFSKTRITDGQLEQQTVNRDIRSKEQLKESISETSERKLREANKPPDDDELHQQKAQDYKEMEDAMIISAPPSDEFVSGILSMQIHNIVGLQTQSLQKENKNNEDDDQEEAERDDDMPDSYCTIILNHKKIYRTRTKPKNSKPFFNAGTERFVRDWRSTEVIVSVRDAREREDDPLIGIVYLPLAKLFADRSQTVDNYPLVGGIGYGRVRISLVWRSVELKLPPNLVGWDYGTLEICGPIRPKGGLPDGLEQQRLKLRTNLGKVKMQAQGGHWKRKGKKGYDDAFLPVRKRYSSLLVIEFRKSTMGSDQTPAFAVLWLMDLVEEEEQTKTLKVWKGGKANLRRAESCCNYGGLEENEEALGEIEVPLRFWRGLSGYHKSYASKVKNNDMRNVMECLDTVNDEKLDDGLSIDDSGDDSDDDGEPQKAGGGKVDRTTESKRKKKLKTHTNDDSTPSNSDDDSDANESRASLPDLGKAKNILRNPVSGGTEAVTSILAPGHNDSDDSSRGVKNSLRDYKDHHKQLHRTHRGIMQWKAAREVDHMGGKLGRLKGNISQVFTHGEKDAGVETEV